MDQAYLLNIPWWDWRKYDDDVGNHDCDYGDNGDHGDDDFDAHHVDMVMMLVMMVIMVIMAMMMTIMWTRLTFEHSWVG